MVADQLTKLWIRSNLDVGQSIPETGFCRLTHVQNTGAAFGLFFGQTFPLTITSIIGIFVILIYNFYVNRRYPVLNNRLGKVALGLILGGTVGNLIDRLRLGYVTDFVTVGPWPSFNIADSMVVIGAIVLVLSFLWLSIKEGKTQPTG